MRRLIWCALGMMGVVLAVWAKDEPAKVGHDAVRVSKTLGVEVTVPVCVQAGAEGVTVPVVIKNVSGREAVVVWELPRNVRVWRRAISVDTGGWGSDKKQWLTLKAGETAKREVVLKFGEDLPALDEGNYALSLDFCEKREESKHEQIEVTVHAVGQPVGMTLAKVVEEAIRFHSARPRDKHANMEHWELTPTMYRGEWFITFGEAGRGPVASVCVNKRTGKGSEPAPIP